MSLRDLLPPGTFDEIAKELESKNKKACSADVCPVCRKKVVTDSSNKFRPFCSEKCRTIDLGAWASGDYCVQGKTIEEDPTTDTLKDAE